ncbi:MAG: hypothetical protein Q8K38_03315 [Burkholderiaceae bacterium]|nr:hypothetical protein [Burkholderiaceae bacterium]MDZ4144474.1 hypothetical protein [Burkholderiales bacterium]
MKGLSSALLLAGASLLAGLAAAADNASASAGSTASSSNEKLRQIMQQARPQGAASQALASSAQNGPQAVVGLSAERLAERKTLLQSGESALARLQVDTALQAFERAALIAHAADTEIALVRAYMQSGQYRRALAFGAHTAGAHLDVVGGSALYAWLLHVGGQAAIAQRLLQEAEARMPGNALVKSVQKQLLSGAPLATPDLLTLPTRLAPYSASKALPASARVAGSGLLLQDGKHALVPLALLSKSGKLWLCNGLGQLVEARLAQRLAGGVALLRLSQPLPAAENLLVSSSMAFPGSAGYALEYVAAADAAPAWPVLRTGFLGGMLGDSGERKLGIDMPAGPRGGPVFDAAGRLMGLALPAKTGTPGNLDRIMPVSLLSQALGGAVKLGMAAPKGAAPPASADVIYETSLKATLQVITVP